MVYSLVYVSEVTTPLSGQDLAALMRQSRRSNVLTQVTGLLLHQPGTFLQLLEGRRDVVEALYAKIGNDSRHQNVTTVRTREQAARQFPDWSMAVGQTSDVMRLGGHGVDVFIDGPAPVTTTDAEALFVQELLDLFDP